jgi:MFS family permease
VVFYLGLTSLFTDISSEMVASVLPLYFLITLGFSPLQFGLMDGLYQGSSAVVRLAGGMVADRWRRHKDVAVAGYALSALSRLGLLAAGGVPALVTAAILADRTGKGIRTAPRDALISLSTPRESLGAAFGVHRALDTLGALLGPVAAFVLLMLAPGAFDAVFVVSFCTGLVGLAILVLFVQNRSAPAGTETRSRGPRSPFRLLRAPGFRPLLVAGAGLGLVTLSDGFVYLLLQRQIRLQTGFFPLFFVATAVIYFLLAVPAGRLADRLGRGRVFLAAHLLLLALYGLLLLPDAGRAGAVAALCLLGGYYAATDGVIMARASALLPAASRAGGLALLGTSNSLARLGGSVLFGAIWTWGGPRLAVTIFLVGLTLAVVLAAPILLRPESEPAHAD